MTDAVSWRTWLLTQDIGRYFVEIDDSFLSDPFNWYGLPQKVAHFHLALELIRSRYIEPSAYPVDWPATLNDHAATLYGVLHARYLMTREGRVRMRQKYEICDFERCPRTLCRGIKCIPMGICDSVGKAGMKLFCPNCHEMYEARKTAAVDGAFFGTSWVYPFLKQYSEIVPEGPPEKFVPKLFGYRVADVRL